MQASIHKERSKFNIELIMRRQRTVLALRIIPFYVHSATIIIVAGLKKKEHPEGCEAITVSRLLPWSWCRQCQQSRDPELGHQ
jgi:hypothetical protein